MHIGESLIVETDGSLQGIGLNWSLTPSGEKMLEARSLEARLCFLACGDRLHIGDTCGDKTGWFSLRFLKGGEPRSGVLGARGGRPDVPDRIDMGVGSRPTVFPNADTSLLRGEVRRGSRPVGGPSMCGEVMWGKGSAEGVPSVGRVGFCGLAKQLPTIFCTDLLDREEVSVTVFIRKFSADFWPLRGDFMKIARDPGRGLRLTGEILNGLPLTGEIRKLIGSFGSMSSIGCNPGENTGTPVVSSSFETGVAMCEGMRLARSSGRNGEHENTPPAKLGAMFMSQLALARSGVMVGLRVGPRCRISMGDMYVAFICSTSVSFLGVLGASLTTGGLIASSSSSSGAGLLSCSMGSSVSNMFWQLTHLHTIVHLTFPLKHSQYRFKQ